MAISITDEEWEALGPESFDTTTLLRAVDAVDAMRDHLNDGEEGRPPQLRTDLLRLHQLAMAVINSGARSQVPALFELAANLDDDVSDLVESLEAIRDTLAELMDLYPESLSYGDDDPDREDDPDTV
jgi:hypothetical protein